MSPRILAIVVNYKSAQLALAALDSLAPQLAAYPGSRAVLVENDSRDGSLEQLRAGLAARRFDVPVELAAQSANLGFAAGNNVALRTLLAGDPDAACDYAYLLNPDTKLRAHALRELVDFCEQHARVGIAGSRLEDEDGTQQHSRFRFHSLASELDSGLRFGPVTRLLAKHTIAPPLVQSAHRIDWVAGASMLVRRALVEEIGLLDEGYFLYFEETDYCLRAARAGWECWYVPTSRVVHYVGRSSGLTNEKEPRIRRPRYWFESRRRYFAKNHGALYAWAADLTWLAGYSLWRVRRRLTRKPDFDPPHLWADFARFLFLPGSASSPARATTAHERARA
jgi:N-acetylglucosaminyl-diphospho-decaprenol L-rhamnosyltransferase